MGVILKILFTLLISAALMIGGCAYVINKTKDGVGASLKENLGNELERVTGAKRITRTQMRGIRKGTPYRRVIRKLGKPLITQREGRLCIYYAAKSRDLGDYWRLCFNKKKRLVSKRRASSGFEGNPI